MAKIALKITLKTYLIYCFNNASNNLLQGHISIFS